MNRSYYTNAIILNLKPTGENNCTVTVLTPDKGIIYATLYGGPKSKLKSLVALWHSGKIWLYENPEKKQTKISDMEVAIITRALDKTCLSSMQPLLPQSLQ